MKRWISLALCIVVCFGLFCGCGKQEETKGEYSQTLSDELRAEITSHYGGEGKSDDADTVAGYEYCGTYNGYVILLSFGQMTVPTSVEIDGRAFSWPHSMKIWAYKDGKETDLETIYENGVISGADLDQIHENYCKFAAERL